MTLLLILIVLTSVWCIGITIATQENMVFYFMREWADIKYEQGKKWVEPLIRCYWCMPSIHSILGYVFAWGMGLIDVFSWKLVVIYPLVVCGASIINGLVWLTLTLLMKKIEYYEELNDNLIFDIQEESIADDPMNDTYFQRFN